MNIRHNGAPITDVTPGGAPIYVPGFEMVPAARSDAVQGMPGRMLQVQHDGGDIGNDRPAVINVVADTARLLVTRGVGENAHVVTFKNLVIRSFFTSIIYPFVVEDSMAVSVSALIAAGLQRMTEEGLAVPVPSLMSGTLVANITYIDYINWRDINPETLAVPVPSLQSGTLIVTITYLNYTNWRDVNPETLAVPVPTLQSGTLVVTIAYLDYINWRDQNPETLAVPVPTLQSGTLV